MGQSMLTRQTVAIRFDSEMAPPARVGRWFELLRAFEKKNPTGTRTERVTDKQLAEIVSNFDRAVPVGYNHAFLKGATSPEETAAAGWIQEVRINENGILEGRIEFNDAGAKRVKGDEFKFLSAELVPNAENPDPSAEDKIGAKLIGAAVTNHPFVDGLAPLSLDDSGDRLFCEFVAEQTQTETEEDRSMSDAIIKALALSDGATEADAVQALSELRTKVETLEAEKAEADKATDEAKNEAQTLSDRVAALETENTRKDATAWVDGKIRSGRLLPSQRDAVIRVFCDAGEDACTGLLLPEDNDARQLFDEKGTADSGAAEDTTPEDGGDKALAMLLDDPTKWMDRARSLGFGTPLEAILHDNPGIIPAKGDA